MNPIGLTALTCREDGTRVDPHTPEEWDSWVSAGRTRNFCQDDPLLDWLDRYGQQHGFVRDDELDGHDPRTDFEVFLFERGRLFEEAVVRLVRDRLETVRVAYGRDDVRDLAKAQDTFRAMRAGVPVVEQAVLRNPRNCTYGAVDLLMRSDVLHELFPDCLDFEESRANATALGDQAWHYRAIDIKFHTLGLLRDGRASGDDLAFMVQVFIYNEALGRIQGYAAPASYLLGRCWTQGKDRGLGCLERIARVDQDRVLDKQGRTLTQVAANVLDWIRKLRREGAQWEALPEPSVPELYPHARNNMDQPWHTAKTYIAQQLAELTLLPAMNPERRRQAHAAGLRRWDDPRVSSEALAITPVWRAEQCDAVLKANRSAGDEVVFPAHIQHADQEWREPAPLELYVDFETVSNLDDDFSNMPSIGGQPLIFQIGCGWYEDGDWQFRQWTVDSLTERSEAEILDAWIGQMRAMLEQSGLTWPDARLFHWSPAEWVNLSSSYNSARARHPEREWPILPWYDFLVEVVRKEPVTVKGAFNFGLKSIAKGMHKAGLIQTSWADGPTDGLGAMVGAWWCAREAARSGVSMRELGLMREIGRYNEVDCRAMAEIVGWLRANR